MRSPLVFYKRLENNCLELYRKYYNMFEYLCRWPIYTAVSYTSYISYIQPVNVIATIIVLIYESVLHTYMK